MKEQFVDLGPRRKNLVLNVASDGPAEGPPVVLLHGFPETWWSWRHQIGPLARAGFRVLAPDLRGAGKSDVRAPYRLSDLADDIAALIDVELDGAPARIVGHDWGGATAWTLARHHPGYVERLAIVNSCLPEKEIEALSTRFDAEQFSRSWYVLMFQVPFLPERLLSFGHAALVKWIVRKGMKDPSGLTDEELEPYCKAAMRCRGAAGMLGPYRDAFRRALVDLVRSGDPFPERQRIGCPTLVLWGDADPAQGVELLDGTNDVAHDLRIVHLPRCGHFPQSEAPDVVSDALLSFLSE